MSDPKKQHYVPQVYLREFVDPFTPQGQEPYVWLFSKDGKTKIKRAPKNVLWETNLYTFEKDGTKYYELEKLLSKIESDYADVVRTKIKAHRPLTDAEHAALCSFAAAMLQRTVRQRDNLEGFYDELITKVERIEERHGAASSTSSKLKAEKKDFHRMGIAAVLSDISELLCRMSLAFLCTDGTDSSFITSDDPVTLFNPDLQWQRFYGPGLAQKNVQLTMAVSPLITLCMTWSNLRGYIRLPRTRVEDLNRMTRAHCYRHFVAHSPWRRLVWFSPVPLHSSWFLVTFAWRLIKQSIEQAKHKYRYRRVGRG